MSLSEKDYNIIEAYLDGNLQPEQDPYFQDRLKDPSFRQELSTQASIQDAIKSNTNHAFIQKLKSSQPTPLDKNNNKWRLGILIILSILVAAFVLYNYGTNQSQTDTPPNQLAYLVPYPPQTFERGTDPTWTDSLSEAMQLYSKGSYAEARYEFQAKARDQEIVKLYIANCSIFMDDFETAKSELFALRASDDQQIKQNADWYLAMTFYEMGQKQHCFDILDQIIGSSNHLFYSKAQQFISQKR